MAESTNNIECALQCVRDRIQAAHLRKPPENGDKEPQLLAVTKTKPVEAIVKAYNCGQLHFGENYVQELVDKANDKRILENCQEIKWHFIGHLQRNKVNKLLSVPNLHHVETIDSQKLASTLDAAWQKKSEDCLLNVMVQINTSAEENKSGIAPAEAPALVKFVLEQCQRLHFTGLMTIGSFDHDLGRGPNPDFQCLFECKNNVCEMLKLDKSEVALSMGMSHDFEHAIEMGSTNVRVGSTIFGPREYQVSTD